MSHRAAAALWGLDGVARAPIELSTTSGRRGMGSALLVHHVRALPPGQIIFREGIPVTSAERTIFDLAAVVSPAKVELALESALRTELVTVASMVNCLHLSSSTRAGRGVLRSLLGLRVEVTTESALEALVIRTLRTANVPPPVRQHEVRDPTGRFVARVDFAYPDERLAIEADGYRFHSSPRDWRRDRARQNALTRLGWTVYRVTWEDINSRSRAFIDDVVSLLGSHSRGSAIKVLPGAARRG